MKNLQQTKIIQKQFSRFVVVGFINTAIDFFVLNVLSFLTGIEKGAGAAILSSVSFLIANLNSYILNKKWTFKEHSAKGISRQFTKFFSVSLGGMVINFVVVGVLTTYVQLPFEIDDRIWLNLSKATAVGIAMFWNFFGYKFLVFKK